MYQYDAEILQILLSAKLAIAAATVRCRNSECTLEAPKRYMAETQHILFQLNSPRYIHQNDGCRNFAS